MEEIGSNLADLSEVGDGRVVKMEVDYSADVDQLLPEAEILCKNGNLHSAVDRLYALEKQTRLGADMRSNARIQIGIVKLCFTSKDFVALNENIITLSKKRSLIKHAVTKMVQECCTYIDLIDDLQTKLKLIDTLRTVTSGKIYVEVERARLTRRLAGIREGEGNVAEAATLLLDLQVETYGSMERQEKMELLLEQMRLCLARKDYTRAQIISRKISTKFFEDTKSEVQLLKLKFYQQMIELDSNSSNYLAICQHYLAVYNTPIVQQEPEKLSEALKNAVIYVLLAPHDNAQSDLLHRIKANTNLEIIATYKELLGLFSVNEIIDWNQAVVKPYEAKLLADSAVASIFSSKTEAGKKCWEDLKTRVAEHNIRMVAKYYTRITLKRLSRLLESPEKSTEEFLCKMVVDGTIPCAKIDRLTGIVDFRPKKSATEVLDEWSGNANKLMDLLNKCSHLILREEMVHKHLHVASEAKAS